MFASRRARAHYRYPDQQQWTQDGIGQSQRGEQRRRSLGNHKRGQDWRLRGDGSLRILRRHGRYRVSPTTANIVKSAPGRAAHPATCTGNSKTIEGSKGSRPVMKNRLTATGPFAILRTCHAEVSACHPEPVEGPGTEGCTKRGRLAQWESASLTRKRPLVQSHHRPPFLDAASFEPASFAYFDQFRVLVARA